MARKGASNHRRNPLIQGEKYNRLEVVGPDPTNTRSGVGLLWIFSCDCGKRHIARGAAVRSGDTKSCGCFARERRIDRWHRIRISECNELSLALSQTAYAAMKCGSLKDMAAVRANLSRNKRLRVRWVIPINGELHP